MILLLLLALQVNPELAQHVNAGLKAQKAGDLPAAIREFQKVVQLAPTLAAAHVNLGSVYYQSKDYQNAVPSLRRALELNSNLPGAHEMLGASLLAQGWPAEAIPHLEASGSTDLLGVALLEAGREREAIERLEAAITKRPNDEDLLYYLSHAHQRLAKRLAERLLTESPDSAKAHQLIGEAQAEAGNRDAAIAAFRAALASRPELRGVHYALGELFLESGDSTSAEREFRAEVKLAPGSGAAAFKLGATLFQNGQTAAALQELERAEKLAPGMPETLLELGRAQAATGSSPAAEKSFLRVLAQERESGLAESAHFQLAQLYRSTGRAAEAEKEMNAFRRIREERRKSLTSK